MIENWEKLLFNIAHCPNVEQCFREKDMSHPCYPVIMSQNQESLEEFQIPEPWSGKLESAPLLFLSSNPSFSKTEAYPTWASRNSKIRDYFVNRFSGGGRNWVKDGKYALDKQGNYLPATRYWSEIINRSKELYARDVYPGIDYALAEIVHCKSKDMIGVNEAKEECVKRYFWLLVEESGAKVIAVMGKSPGNIVKNIINAQDKQKYFEPVVIGGRKRLVLFLPAPGSSMPRKIEKVFSPKEIKLIQNYLLD